MHIHVLWRRQLLPFHQGKIVTNCLRGSEINTVFSWIIEQFPSFNKCRSIFSIHTSKNVATAIWNFLNLSTSKKHNCCDNYSRKYVRLALAIFLFLSSWKPKKFWAAEWYRLKVLFNCCRDFDNSLWNLSAYFFGRRPSATNAGSMTKVIILKQTFYLTIWREESVSNDTRLSLSFVCRLLLLKRLDKYLNWYFKELQLLAWNPVCLHSRQSNAVRSRFAVQILCHHSLVRPLI